jgi:DNA repair exonuclease SbcCD ATPase subunit
MADVNGGALSFTSIMDNDQMNAAIEETLRRVQGFSDAVVGSGDTMDNTTQEIVESIQIQKRVIEELEKTVADLNERINSVEPGTAQDALIEQANAARAELDGEKQGMVALINELNNLQRANEGAASASEDIRNGLSQIGAACEMHENAIAALKKEYEQITQTMNGALKSGNDNEYRALRDRAQAIKGEIATRKSLLNELREQSNALEDEASRMEQARAAAENTAQAHVSLRQQIRALKEEMADAVANGIDEQSEAYKRMVNELGRLQDIQGDIQSQGSVLANDEATFAGILSGLNGVVGGFTAAQGAVALFAGENENLQKIMLKVQSLMSITMGLQQVAQTLNKDSAFSLITLNKAKEWWNNLLAVGRGEQIASTAATAADTTATIASTAATTGNAAAEQASNTAKTASVGASTGAAAAQAVQTASATAGTVANIGLAGAFRMVGAAIKSIPVFGWILAGISALIALVSHFVSKANESKKATEEWYNAIAENAYKPIASIMELSDKWNALGNDLEAKKQFIENNKKAFEDLGVSVRDVVDAENVLVANKTAFINAQIEKAKATIYLQQAQEKVKELIKKEQEYNAMSDTKSMWVQTSTFGTGYWVETANNEKKKAKTALDGLRAEISRGFQNAANAERNGWNILKKAGIGATQTYTKGSLGAIEQAIQLKQEALKHLTNNDDYKKAMAEIEKLQKQADKITGKTTTTSGNGGGSSNHRSSGGGGTKKDAFLEKLAKYKSEYSRFLKWVNSNDPIIQQAAKKEFDGLLKQGATYIDYLKNQRDIILQVDVANRSKTQNKQLRQLNDAIAEETKKTVLEAFNNELSDSLSNAKTVIEMLNVIEAKRKQLANDGTELDNAEKEALDNAEKQAQEKAKQETNALLTEYASYAEQKRRLEEQFNADMELLNRKRAKASTDAEKAEIDQAIANRTKKYNTDTSKVGDYDAILNQYGGYEQKKARIAEQYAERRRVAELNGNKDLLEKLAKAEQDELSKLQSDLIKNSGDWQNLFGNLDELTTKTIKKLIAKIEGMKATIGVDLNPQDLKALTDQLNKARSEVEKRNPFTALGAAWKRLKEATKDGKGLGSDEAKKATKDVATAVSGSIDLINGTFNAVTNGLQKMGVSMDEETQAILGDIGGIMDGASQVAQGIATGNPLSVIQGSIGLLSSAFDLFNSRDRKAEKQIKKHQKAIKQLENAYKQLEWQIGKALGGEVYKNQQAAIRNMKEQQEHLKASWEAEESKKKTDHDRVNDFKEQYAELGRQIEDMVDEISNDLLQTTAKDFANDLGDALVEAFGKGEDAAKAMETTVNSVLKNLVVNQLKKKFLENQLQGALDKLEKDMGYWNGDDFVFDGLTQTEIDRFKSAVGAASSNFNQALKQYEEIFKDMGLDDTDESLTGAVKGVSEETANILAGQMNAIRINQLDANEVLRQSLQALNTIAINTAYNKYLSRIERIITIMESNQGGNALRSQGLS